MINSSVRRATIDAIACLLAVLCLHCVAAKPSMGKSLEAIREPRGEEAAMFDYQSLDGRAVSAAAMRGKPTVLTFVTTDSLAAQAQVDFLVAMAKRDASAVNYAVVAIEPGDRRELVDLYRRVLHITFPVAIADGETLGGGGSFGDVRGVPVTVILDREGHVVWRADGRIARSEELRSAMSGVQ
jgi:hypothetical protein